MQIKHYILFFLLFFSIVAKGQNNPYVDDKLFHFGFSLSLNFMDYYIEESGMKFPATEEEAAAEQGEVYHVRQSGMMPGFSVGFITDVRLARYLNLRFTPTLHFGEHRLNYKTESGKPIPTTPDNPNPSTLSLRALPISIPFYLKWSAARENNYRPYLIGGGGVKFDFMSMDDKNTPIMRDYLDYFLEIGAGCDFYFRWFKFCPQITYSIGFNNVLIPLEERFKPEELAGFADPFYTQAIGKMLQRQITITFNFE